MDGWFKQLLFRDGGCFISRILEEWMNKEMFLAFAPI